MERAVRLLKDRKISREIVTDEDIARAVWPAAVGKAISAHTSRIKLLRATLVVEVEDAIWQRQLYSLSGQILERLHRLTGSAQIESIEFRVAIPRRQPQRANAPVSDVRTGTCEDEAESIQDPVLKKVYRMSRRKAVG